MNYLYTKGTECTYPVGSNMDKANEYINSAYELFLKIGFRGEVIHLFSRGSSGNILATLFSIKAMKDGYKVLIHNILKNNETSHINGIINISEYDEIKEIYLIIDDFVSSGNTLTAIAASIPQKIKKYGIIVNRTHIFLEKFPEYENKIDFCIDVTETFKGLEGYKMRTRGKKIFIYQEF